MVLWTLNPSGTRGDLLADLLQLGEFDAGPAAPLVVLRAGGLQMRPAAVEPVGLVGPVARAGLELGVELLAELRLLRLDLVRGHHALGDELLGIDLQGRAMAADGLVHQGLGEARLVALVMAEAAIAEHVDDDRLVELLPELHRHLGGEGHGLGVVAVDVEDRRLDHLGHVGRIGRGPRIARIGGEADLVVDDEVERAAGPVALEARQAETFRDDALAREGGVAVQQQRHHLLALDLVVQLVLLGAHLAEHHRIDDLEMGRIGGQRQMDLVAVELAVRRGAEVILDVARALDLLRRGRAALELVEDGAVRLAHHLGQHVEPPAMRHAEHDLADAERAAALDDLLQRRDHGFGAVEAEALGAGVADVEELLEALGLDELLQDGALALAGEGDLLVRPLDAELHPCLLVRIRDVHELEADGRAIGAAQDVEHLAHGRVLEAEHVVDEDRPVVVGLA